MKVNITEVTDLQKLQMQVTKKLKIFAACSQGLALQAKCTLSTLSCDFLW